MIIHVERSQLYVSAEGHLLQNVYAMLVSLPHLLYNKRERHHCYFGQLLKSNAIMLRIVTMPPGIIFPVLTKPGPIINTRRPERADAKRVLPVNPHMINARPLPPPAMRDALLFFLMYPMTPPIAMQKPIP